MPVIPDLQVRKDRKGRRTGESDGVAVPVIPGLEVRN